MHSVAGWIYITESRRLVPLLRRFQLLQLLLQELGFEPVVSLLLLLGAARLGVRGALALVVQLLVQLSDVLQGIVLRSF